MDVRVCVCLSVHVAGMQRKKKKPHSPLQCELRQIKKIK